MHDVRPIRRHVPALPAEFSVGSVARVGANPLDGSDSMVGNRWTCGDGSRLNTQDNTLGSSHASAGKIASRKSSCFTEEGDSNAERKVSSA